MSTYSRFAFRVLKFFLGVLFLWSGLSKALSGFSAESYLLASYGPLSGIFKWMAGQVWVDMMVVFGEIAVGISLMTGLYLGLGTLGGMLMMTLFFLAKLPPEGVWVNNQVIYFLVLMLIRTVHQHEDQELSALIR